MARFAGDADFQGWSALNLRLQNLAADPGSPKVGQLWFNTGAGGDGQGRPKVKLATRTIVLDDQYVTGVNIITTDTFGTPFTLISEPRMWGVEATVAF